MSIFTYTDYREYLKDFLKNRQAIGEAASYRWLNQRAGFTSPNYLHLVIHGKRHLSSDASVRLGKVMKLNRSEADFFYKLVEFNKAKTLSQKEKVAAELVQFKGYQNIYPLAETQYEYYQKWYYVAVRELLNLELESHNPKYMALQLLPEVSEKELTLALQVLSRLELIQPQTNIKNVETNNKSNKKWKPTNESISTGNQVSGPISRMAVVNFHKAMLNLASQSLDRFPGKERDISSVTIALSEKSFDTARKKVQELRRDLMALAESDKNKERLYQFNFQIFPISKCRSKKINTN